MRTRNRFKFDEGTDENKENMPEKKRPTSTLARGNSKQKTKEGRSGSKNEKATRSNTDSVRKSVRFSEVDRQQKDSKVAEGNKEVVAGSNGSNSRISTCSLDESVFKSRLLESSNASTPLSKLSPKDLIDSSSDEREINSNPKFDAENGSTSNPKAGQSSNSKYSKNVKDVLKSGTTTEQSEELRNVGHVDKQDSEVAPTRQLRVRKRMNDIGNLQKEQNDDETSDSECESSSSNGRSKKTKKRTSKKGNVSKSELNETRNKSHNLSKSFVDFETKMAKNEDVQRQLEIERQLLEDFEEVDSFELCIE